MRLYFGGGDSPSWRKRLLANDVKRIAVNFTDLLPRLPKTKDWLLADHFPDDVDLLMYWTPKEWDESGRSAFSERYSTFVDSNAGRLVNSLQFDGAPLDGIPLWDGESRPEHVLLQAEDNLVALTSHQLEDRKARSFMATVRHRRGQLVGLGVSDPTATRGSRCRHLLVVDQRSSLRRDGGVGRCSAASVPSGAQGRGAPALPCSHPPSRCRPPGRAR